MRTLTSTAALAVGGGLALGLMTAPAFAAPSGSPAAAPATARDAGDTGARERWHIKNAKNVSSAPNRKLVCTFVYGEGGKPTYGKVCFQPKGDKFWVQDRRSDGMHIRMRAIYSGHWQTIYDCRDYHGRAAGWTVCNFNLHENQHIDFNALAYNGRTKKYEGFTVTASN
ncbi:hypothetical protein ACIBF6_21345 [Streptosporangium amethystogenes]|uniref:hypothetical protein n=1 Tax=Streptosporangium amethystogenes TaxID=2002 RepID=UPI0037A9FDE9